MHQLSKKEDSIKGFAKIVNLLLDQKYDLYSTTFLVSVYCGPSLHKLDCKLDRNRLCSAEKMKFSYRDE